MTVLFSGQELKMSLDAGCATLTFDNPSKLNALSLEMARECLLATEILLARNDVSVLVLRGSGRAFVAGGDLQALQAAPQPTALGIMESMHACILSWHAAPWLTLAAVQGPAAGAGLSLVAAADLVLASHSSRFVYAYSDIATTPDLGLSWNLIRRIGQRRALEMALLGVTLTAEQALEWGLVNRIVDEDLLEEELQLWLSQLSRHQPEVLQSTRTLFASAPQLTLAEQLDAEQASFLNCAAQPAFSHAVNKFLERGR